MGLSDLYEFDLVADYGVIDLERWAAIQSGLLELLPARSAVLVGDPPTAIRAVGYGGTEVAPGLLARLVELAGKTPLRVVPAQCPTDNRRSGILFLHREVI